MASKRTSYRLLAIYSSIIFLLPATLLGGYYIGWLADGYLETSPWLSLTGLLLGGIAGFVELFRLLGRAR